MLDQTIHRQGTVATLAWPVARVMADLFDKLGWMTRVLALVAHLVLIVAAGTVLAAIYNGMNARRRDFAILRALGAKRRTVFLVVVAEATAITAVGCVLGYLVYAGILAAAFVVVREQTGVHLDVLQVHAVHVWGPVLMVGLGALAGIVPALKAYRTDVADGLAPLR